MSLYKIKKIPGYLGYWADTEGCIWSAKKFIGDSVWITTDKPTRKLRPTLHPSMYYIVNLCTAGISKTMKIHTLVLLTFVGDKPKGMQCCHYDNDKLNNKIENLRWDTHAANDMRMWNYVWIEF